MTPSPGIAVLRLADILDVNEARPLSARLTALRGQPLVLDASAVSRIGGLCLQVLLAARKSWLADKHPLAIVHPSPDFAAAVTLFGASDLIAVKEHP